MTYFMDAQEMQVMAREDQSGSIFLTGKNAIDGVVVRFRVGLPKAVYYVILEACIHCRGVFEVPSLKSTMKLVSGG